jgi:crotonobetainyl-CoA:carnitine CoA-transferase CaiB-like acyl-CoA transferase
VRDPRVVARGETVPLVHPKYPSIAEVYGVGMPIKFSGSYAGFDAPAPGAGEHNQEVYSGLLGYSAAKIDSLKSRGVI